MDGGSAGYAGAFTCLAGDPKDRAERSDSVVHRIQRRIGANLTSPGFFQSMFNSAESIVQIAFVDFRHSSEPESAADRFDGAIE